MAGQLEAFLAQPAPRYPSPELRKAIRTWRGHRAIVAFGLLFGTFGLLFCFVFLPWKWPLEWKLDHSEPVIVPGQVVEVSATNLSINESKVWKVEVAYRDMGDDRVSTGYVTGKKFSEGEPVNVRVHPDDPGLSCPEGTRMSEGSLFSSFVLVFPLVGYGLVAGAVVSRARRIKLLTRGRAGTARVIGCKETMTSVDDCKVHKLTLQIPEVPGTVLIKRHRPLEVRMLREAMESGDPLKIVYDPAKPKRLLIPEAWAGMG